MHHVWVLGHHVVWVLGHDVWVSGWWHGMELHHVLVDLGELWDWSEVQNEEVGHVLSGLLEVLSLNINGD